MYCYDSLLVGRGRDVLADSHIWLNIKELIIVILCRSEQEK